MQQNPSKPRGSEHDMSVEFGAVELSVGTIVGVVDCGLGSGVIDGSVVCGTGSNVVVVGKFVSISGVVLIV